MLLMILETNRLILHELTYDDLSSLNNENAVTTVYCISQEEWKNERTDKSIP